VRDEDVLLARQHRHLIAVRAGSGARDGAAIDVETITLVNVAKHHMPAASQRTVRPQGAVVDHHLYIVGSQ